MQALKRELWVKPQLGTELSSCFDVKRRSRRNHVFYGRNSGFLLLASNSRAFSYEDILERTKLDLGCGFLSGLSRLKVAWFCKHRKNYLGASSASMALASEKQSTGSELQLDDLDSEASLLGKSGDTQLNIVESVTKKKIVEEKSDDRVNVRELASSLRLVKTADDVDEILKEKGVLPLQVYTTVIKGLGKEKLLEPAFAVFEWIKRMKDETDGLIGPNLFVYNSLLGAVKQSGEFRSVEKILDDMARDGIDPNIVTYNTKMAIYLEESRFDEALEIIDEIREKGLVPSPVTYSTAMLAYRKMEDPNGALNLFVDVREKYRNGEISEDKELSKLENFTIRICYQVMRNWLAKKEDNLSTKVIKLLTAMDVAGIPPGRSEHEKLLWACTREEHALLAKELYDRIRDRNSEISLSVCNHVIWLMGKAKKWWTALEVYEDLMEKGPRPNNLSNEIIVSHFNVLLGAARRRGIWKWGARLLEKMEEKGLEPGTREWNAVLVACSKASEPTAAVDIFKRMVEKGQKPTSLSYGALLSALEKGKLYSEARRVWEHMQKLNLEPNAHAFTIMASVFAAQEKFNLVNIILQDMASSGIEPGVITYNAIITGCVRNGSIGAAFEWLRRMESAEISPNEATYEILVEALAKDSKPRLAFEMYLKAQNEGLELGPKAYDALVESSRAQKATVDLRLLGNRPPDKREKAREFDD